MGWQHVFPGSHDAAHLRAWLCDRVEEIDHGDVGVAINDLRAWGAWQQNFDLKHTPADVKLQIGEAVQAAVKALEKKTPDNDGAHAVLAGAVMLL